jgi:hypothetical protein
LKPEKKEAPGQGLLFLSLGWRALPPQGICTPCGELAENISGKYNNAEI